MRTGSWWSAAAGLVAALALAACGGGGEVSPAGPAVSIKVFGDALSDVGTFGSKATVQGPESRLYPELIADLYGSSRQCNHFVATGATIAPNAGTTACTNFAVGGGVINPAATGVPSADPRSLEVQLRAAVAASPYAPSDLLMVHIGHDDFAALLAAYLHWRHVVYRADVPVSVAFVDQLHTLLDPAVVDAALAGNPLGRDVGILYMEALAERYYALLSNQALARGPQRIVLVNWPDMTTTLWFYDLTSHNMFYAFLGAPGLALTAATSSVVTTSKAWISAFNNRLAELASRDPRVLLVDYYAESRRFAQSPAEFGLTNLGPVCTPLPKPRPSIIPVGTTWIWVYDLPNCTAAALSASPPVPPDPRAPTDGSTATADWWTRFLLADDYYPTPYGHVLLARMIARRLGEVGWL